MLLISQPDTSSRTQGQPGAMRRRPRLEVELYLINPTKSYIVNTTQATQGRGVGKQKTEGNDGRRCQIHDVLLLLSLSKRRLL